MPLDPFAPGDKGEVHSSCYPAGVFDTINSMDLSSLAQSVKAQFHVVMGSARKVSSDCSEMRRLFSSPLSAGDMRVLRELLPLLHTRSGELAAALFNLFESTLAASPDPLLLLDGMLSARDPDLARRALACTLRLIEQGAVNSSLAIRLLAEQAAIDRSGLAERDSLARIAAALRSRSSGPDPILDLFLKDKQPNVRLLAARTLDLDQTPVPDDVAAQLLAPEAFTFLARYLAYTRASHLDLLYLVPVPGGPPPSLASLERTEEALGENLLREVISKLGWPRVNLGIEVRTCVGISVAGSLPLMVSEPEAEFLGRCGEVRRTSTQQLVIAHGGHPAEASLVGRHVCCGRPGQESGAPDAEDTNPINRFRDYNLTHADVLVDLLDVAPLTPEKVLHILEHMDKIVEDYSSLFAALSEECSILPEIYRDLRGRILAELDRAAGQSQLSMELTRLVQMFEDPGSLGAVETLHGLKRYLHQRGLALGAKLVEAGPSDNRSVDLVLCSGGKVQSVIQQIQYSDFELEAGQHDRLILPYSVEIVADAFGLQALHGHRDFPLARIFCYGNEVHYYFSFRNHPAFVRIDFSPPLRGGMIDLEYFGLSKYEISEHPNPGLEAVQAFFRRLDFEVGNDNSRIHARYDKERARDLETLCEKADMVFRLAPYLMDLDWIIGSLDLSPEARGKVTQSWAESFERWGVLPLRQLLTRNRLGIVQSLASSPSGESEIAWSGEGAYRDRFSTAPPPDFFRALRSALDQLSLECAHSAAGSCSDLYGQVRMEHRVLQPLRAALRRGEIIATSAGFERADAELFERIPEAEQFAAILASGEDAVAQAALVARLVTPLERTLTLGTTGTVEGWTVQHAALPLRGVSLGLYALRDHQGIIRQAFFTFDDVVYRRRRQTSDPWEYNSSCSHATLASLLRRNQYTVKDPPEENVGAQAAKILAGVRESARLPSGGRDLSSLIAGLGASPGRAIGRVLFGTAGRSQEDFDGAVLVAPAVGPEDTIFLYRSAAVVSTGGGILSHAGLTALQFRKPAVIISGRWDQEVNGCPTLRYLTHEYREQEKNVAGYTVTLRRNMRDHEHRLREGDLVVVDGAEGTVRVLGQDGDAVGLHEALRHLGKSSRSLSEATDEKDILLLRGRQLRARHQIEKVLKRISDPALANHAVYELLLGESLPGDAAAEERIQLLKLVLSNAQIYDAARESLIRISIELGRRFEDACGKARNRIPAAAFLWEVLQLRLDVIRGHETLTGARASLQECGIEAPRPDACLIHEIDGMARQRLEQLFVPGMQHVRALLDSGPQDVAAVRHEYRTLARIAEVVDARPEDLQMLDAMRRRLSTHDEGARLGLARRRIVGPEDGGLELAPLSGWKAANLAEMQRLAGPGFVPPWFAVTNFAFEEVLDSPLEDMAPGLKEIAPGLATIRAAIEFILARSNLTCAQKSAQIRALWQAVTLPDGLSAEVIRSYLRIAPESGQGFVAIRSSALEEDTEAAARAGEFETFLFVSGRQSVLEHLKKTWSGLWTERAIHNRGLFGAESRHAGGGVIVQRIVWSRVSGVLQTVNAARGDLSEMVINAGHGLGEGVVSGTVAADQITVMKEGDMERGPLRFRYVTSDKRERVVFDKRTGQGTVRTETLYHQRLRPALEYAELCELVAIAAGLERAYGYPLDFEFGIEGTKLWILQARPVASALSCFRQTLDRYPFEKKKTDRTTGSTGYSTTSS